MKIKLATLGLFLVAATLVTSCNDDDGIKKDGPDPKKEKVILSKYPNAQAIVWAKSKDKKYDIATFNLPKAASKAAAVPVDTVSVWFGDDDNVRLIDQEISFHELPVGVQEEFKKTKSLFNKELYSDPTSWEIDDVYKLERDGVVSYKLEVEDVKVEMDVDVYFDSQGILLKEVEDKDDADADEAPLEIPENIAKWIKATYPNTEVLDYELDTEGAAKIHELDLRDGKIIIEIELTENGATLTATEEYNYPDVASLPKDVADKLAEFIASQNVFAITDIDDIEMTKENGAEVYAIEFEKANVESELEITKNSDGSFVVGEIETEEE